VGGTIVSFPYVSGVVCVSLSSTHMYFKKKSLVSGLNQPRVYFTSLSTLRETYFLKWEEESVMRYVQD
jgi:hypothetical protein